MQFPSPGDAGAWGGGRDRGAPHAVPGLWMEAGRRGRAMDESSDRAERLAKALRDNLRRRKSQARARTAGSENDASTTPAASNRDAPSDGDDRRTPKGED